MIDPSYAKAILSKLGSTGTPPEFGLELFSVGLDDYLAVLEQEYFKGILRHNLSSFKLVVGNYGGGKTHFLFSVRDLAFRNNFAVAYVSLSPTECPFDRLELVYRQVMSNVVPPLEPSEFVRPMTKGIEALIRAWHRETKIRQGQAGGNLRAALDSIAGTESSSFLNAVKAGYEALVAEDSESFAAAIQWLKGEDIPLDARARFRISERIDRTTAFRMLRSLAQWVHSAGYQGLILLFDEAERGMSITSSRDRRRALDNLRQIVDECGNSRLPGAMLFYAVPDENLLLDGSGGVYEALKQRLRSVFSDVNPLGVRIDLEHLGMNPKDFLRALGQKLSGVFEAAYSMALPSPGVEQTVATLSELVLSAFALDVGYRRLFVVGVIEAFHRLRADPTKQLGRHDLEGILRVTARQIEDLVKQDIETQEF